MPKLNDWSIISITSSCYDAPEKGYPALMGKVYGHPNHKNGTIVITSTVESFAGVSAKTRNSIYTLEKPDEDFLKYLEENGLELADYIDKKDKN